jgi:Flp pilus assembly protein TadB
MLLNPTDKMHFVTTRTLRNVAEHLAYLLLASLLCGIGVGVVHAGLPIVTVGATFLLGGLLMIVLTWRRFAQEWEWRKTLTIRRTG